MTLCISVQIFIDETLHADRKKKRGKWTITCSLRLDFLLFTSCQLESHGSLLCSIYTCTHTVHIQHTQCTHNTLHTKHASLFVSCIFTCSAPQYWPNCCQTTKCFGWYIMLVLKLLSLKTGASSHFLFRYVILSQ